MVIKSYLETPVEVLDTNTPLEAFKFLEDLITSEESQAIFDEACVDYLTGKLSLRQMHWISWGEDLEEPVIKLIGDRPFVGY